MGCSINIGNNVAQQNAAPRLQEWMTWGHSDSRKVCVMYCGSVNDFFKKRMAEKGDEMGADKVLADMKAANYDGDAIEYLFDTFDGHVREHIEGELNNDTTNVKLDTFIDDDGVWEPLAQAYALADLARAIAKAFDSTIIHDVLPHIAYASARITEKYGAEIGYMCASAYCQAVIVSNESKRHIDSALADMLEAIGVSEEDRERVVSAFADDDIDPDEFQGIISEVLDKYKKA